MKTFTPLLLLLSLHFELNGQAAGCEFKQALITIHFGSGNVRDVNAIVPFNYKRITGSCPNDGHYTYTSFTTDCYGGQWHVVNEDHTPGDISGNMMLINASKPGPFLSTTLKGLKGSTTYEFAVWVMNISQNSAQCPSLLLPDINIRLQTVLGKTVAQFSTGEVTRNDEPRWIRYRATFTTPPSETALSMIMIDNNRGGCGNDFAIDDITLRECIKPVPIAVTAPAKAVQRKEQPKLKKAIPGKTPPLLVSTQARIAPTADPEKDAHEYSLPLLKPTPRMITPPPAVLTTRSNPLIKQIETAEGEIAINLYDNGEVDGDTISIYHNNVLLMAHARLSQKPITTRIKVDADHPHHELIMVAENLGSIPPNTSMMVITAGGKRYEVFISSTEQRNAKVVINLKQ